MNDCGKDKARDEYPFVSIVVIGYNEADNLDKTFTAIKSMNYPMHRIEVIYVDSGSSDDSLSIARNYTDKCFLEDRYPSAGRNRNRGLMEAKHDIVHFIDGDMAIDKDYLRRVVSIFEEKHVQAVTGLHIEVGKGPLNKINRLADSGLSRKEGFTIFTSTGATYKKHALLSINGYDERIIRGQESEMGFRFINAGYKIWCTEITMGFHTDGFGNVYSFLKRSSLTGKSLFQLSKLDGDNAYFDRAKRASKRQIIRTAVLSLSFMVSLVFSLTKYFMLVYTIYIIYSNRSVYRKENPASIVLIKVLLKPFMNVFMQYGYYQEAIKYHLGISDKGFYSLHKESLSPKSFK
ncbi:MAG: glycosyltransferase [Sphaerochaetaceae bacterium]|nr:glycosyltransferase [Sphaerochaetaceae bacterium]